VVTRTRKHLTYGNVMSTIFVFLLLAGGTAMAAKQLGKKTVGTKQLKSNAVTTAKIKKGAVTKAKIKDGAIDNSKIADNAVTGSKIADGSVTGGDINAGSTSFSQITARLRNSNSVPIGGPATPYPVGTYTQSVGSDDQYIAALDVTFAASCEQPRYAQAYLLLDAANPSAPVLPDIVGQVVVIDNGAGTTTRRADFGPFAGSFNTLTRMSPLNATQHTFTVLLLGSSCNSGSGINASGAQVDVISTK
jgi:hypothetical protein